MSLDPPTYLSSLQNNIRTRPIPWDGAVRAGTVSEDQLNKIRAVDKVRKDQRKQIIEGDIEGYKALFSNDPEAPIPLLTSTVLSTMIGGASGTSKQVSAALPKKDTIEPLVEILRSAAGVAANGDSASNLWSGTPSVREGSLGGGVGLQLLYHVLLVLWQLSFEGENIGEGLEEKDYPTLNLLSLQYALNEQADPATHCGSG
ncbi:hypothetical protein M7I_5542 [Glarea lozoyensis 74030]|uniref:Uncharacterized protein n=1 Tax=Glarea lozoyensis (strain ATCC 74030 / MF5533) TaxID=1104152 RepID=H0ES64_GLAL7|nr:hypothetical protein M7I_5542 [Glarea lozoyensis 74030]